MMSRLEAPEKYRRDVNVWIDEAIWGHRFYNEQTPWLVFLEFLTIFRDRNSKGCALNEPRSRNSHEDFDYSIPRLVPLRQLVFNNPHVYPIEQSRYSEVEKWNSWMERSEFTDGWGQEYLRKRFSSFSHFARLVGFFQTTAVEPHRQRRWSSKFLFPYSKNCLYADLPGDVVNGSADRRFFARSGELLYLMLNRSGSGPEIAKKISESILCEEGKWDHVIKALSPKDHDLEKRFVNSSIGYLPYGERPEYSALAETWLNLLSLELPGESLLDPLMRLSCLHMLLYMLRRSNEEINDSTEMEPRIVLEIASPSKTTLFELSRDIFGANRTLSMRAVRAHVQAAKKDAAWRKACEAPFPAKAACDFLKERFSWRTDDVPSSGDPDTVFDSLISSSEKRHQQHLAKVHSEWGRQVGLVAARRGIGTWYSPDDSLLKALVMCTVERREEYNRFLADIYERFRLVIGVAEAERAFGHLPTDQNVFIQNTQRLERRLRTLGLLHRLSDDCAYVENPFRRKLSDEKK